MILQQQILNYWRNGILKRIIISASHHTALAKGVGKKYGGSVLSADMNGVH